MCKFYILGQSAKHFHFLASAAFTHSRKLSFAVLHLDKSNGGQQQLPYDYLWSDLCQPQWALKLMYVGKIQSLHSVGQFVIVLPAIRSHPLAGRVLCALCKCSCLLKSTCLPIQRLKQVVHNWSLEYWDRFFSQLAKQTMCHVRLIWSDFLLCSYNCNCKEKFACWKAVSRCKLTEWLQASVWWNVQFVFIFVSCW